MVKGMEARSVLGMIRRVLRGETEGEADRAEWYPLTTYSHLNAPYQPGCTACAPWIVRFIRRLDCRYCIAPL